MPERRSMIVDFLRVSALIGSHLTSSLGDKDGPMVPFAAHHWTLGNAANSEGSIAFHHNTAHTGEPPLESMRSSRASQIGQREAFNSGQGVFRDARPLLVVDVPNLGSKFNGYWDARRKEATEWRRAQKR